MTFSIGTLVAGHTIHIQLDLYPIKTGPRQLQVLISSNEIKEIKGYKDIFVAAARVSSAPPRPALYSPNHPLPSLPEPSTLPTAPLLIP